MENLCLHPEEAVNGARNFRFTQLAGRKMEADWPSDRCPLRVPDKRRAKVCRFLPPRSGRKAPLVRGPGHRRDRTMPALYLQFARPTESPDPLSLAGREQHRPEQRSAERAPMMAHPAKAASDTPWKH